MCVRVFVRSNSSVETVEQRLVYCGNENGKLYELRQLLRGAGSAGLHKPRGGDATAALLRALRSRTSRSASRRPRCSSCRAKSARASCSSSSARSRRAASACPSASSTLISRLNRYTAFLSFTTKPPNLLEYCTCMCNWNKIAVTCVPA